MIIYYAGMQNNVRDLFIAVKNGCQHLMLSYYYDSKRTSRKQWTRFRRLGLHIFLDSGGYSAWQKNIEIDIDKYIEFIKSNHIGKYIVLDKVGDPKKTYENLKYMEKKGLFPIPVFHMGSNFKYLDRLVGEGYYYICLGGTVGKKNKKKRIDFFDKVFDKYPHINFHGLGMTDLELLKKYEWFSVDSTSWLIGIKNSLLQTSSGRLVLPSTMPAQQKTAMNIQFFSRLEKEINASRLASLQR